MSFTDFSKTLGCFRSDVAIFSTFDFDPLYFENRLLGTAALERASRILVFMDGRRYDQLAYQDVHARYANERYLLVPVRPASGAFHPKLHVLLQEKNALIVCGSNNLTQGGSTTNLELLNVLESDGEAVNAAVQCVLADAIGFFLRCCEKADKLLAQTAKEWIAAALRERPWIQAVDSADPVFPLLAETTQGPLWPALEKGMNGRDPERILVISPFYDHDLRLFDAFRTRWDCPIEICAQQQTSNLPVREIGRFDGVTLFAVSCANSRRLHAKLVAFKLGARWLCMTGSANSTTAAFDGTNVEANLIFEVPDAAISGLFEGDVTRQPIAPMQFESGEWVEEVLPTTAKLTLRAAFLDDAGSVRVDVGGQQLGNVYDLRIAFRCSHEQKFRLVKPFGNAAGSPVPVVLRDEEAKDFHGAVVCCLQGKDPEGALLQSNPVWLVQSSKLTRTFGESGGKSARERIVLETGRGTAELLQEKIDREGLDAAILWLNQLNIRFHTEKTMARGLKGFGLGVHDPTLPDTASSWYGKEMGDMAEALEGFVLRHHDRILARHAKSGNVNGLSNFVDVLAECNQMLFMYYRLAHLKVYRAMESILRGVGIMGVGYQFPGQRAYVGYMQTMVEKQGGELSVVREALREVDGLEHLVVGVAMAQVMRWGKSREGNPSQLLPKEIEQVKEAIKIVGGWRGDAARLTAVVYSYRMMNQEDLALIREAAICLFLSLGKNER
jgi:hypothetical protein